MSTDGQPTKWRRNIAKNFSRSGRVHERYRQTTDDRRQAGESHQPISPAGTVAYSGVLPTTPRRQTSVV